MGHLTDRQIEFGKFVERHHEFWKRLPVFTLFFITFLIVSNLGLRWITYTNETIEALFIDRTLAVNYIPYNQLRPMFRPQQPVVTQTGGVFSGNGIDAYALINNPNDKWLAEKVTYQFQIDGAAQQTQTTFLVPGEKKYLMHFNARSTNPRASVRVNIVDVEWRRIRDLSALDIMPQLNVHNVAFQNNPQTDTFEVTGVFDNGSTQGLWTVGLQVIALNRSQIVGINYTALERAHAGANRSISISWPTTITQVDEVRIIPEANIFDDSIFMSLQDQFPIDPSGIE